MITAKVKKLNQCTLYYFGEKNYGIKKPLGYVKEYINIKTNEIINITHIQDDNKMWLKTYGLDGLMIETTNDNILSITQ